MMKFKGAILLGFIFCLASNLVNAQGNVKIGYTSLEYIFENMPESEQIKKELQVYESKLQDQLKSMYTEFEKKLEQYQSGSNTMAESVRSTKEKELQRLQQDIREFEQKAQADLQKKHTALTDPILDKIQDAINKVGEENGYSFILSGEGSVLFAKNKEDDISSLVLKKLGVNSTAAKTTAPVAPKK